MNADNTVSRTTYEDRESWLAGRVGIGASEIGTVLGLSPSRSPLQLWKEKTGQAAPQDLSGNERVSFGNRAEEPLRGMFRLMFPQYTLSFEPFTILQQSGPYSFLFYTPDGELEERLSGRRGLYESKTSTCLSAADWSRWDHKIPQSYYAQICQGMFVGNFDFAVVFALLLNAEGDGTLRSYFFDRRDCEGDIQFMLPKAKQFWNHVESGTAPPAILTL